MSTTLRRSAATLAAVLLALVGLLAASPAKAAVNDPVGSKQVAAFLAAQYASGNITGSGLADAIVGLAADGTQPLTVQKMLTDLEAFAPGYIENPSQAAKVAIAVKAAGGNPRNFAGMDLINKVQTLPYTYEYAYGTGLQAIALFQAGQPLTAQLSKAIYTDIHEGMTTYPSKFVDYDGAGLVLQALSYLAATGDQKAATAAKQMETYLASKLVDGKYWPSYSPANSAGVSGQAWQATGHSVATQVAWLKTQILPDGGLPNKLDGKKSNIMAAEQGLWLLSGANLLPIPASKPTPTPTATPTPTPTPTATPTSAPTSTWTPPKPGPHNYGNSCTEAGNVWVVIEVDSQPYKATCATSPATAMDALKSVATVTLDKYGMICDIDGKTTDNCTKSAYPTYWTFWTSTKLSPAQSAPAATHTGWTYALVGPASYVPPAGSMVGFNFSADVMPHQVLPVATTPTPTPQQPTPTQPNQPTPTQPKLPATGGEPLTGLLTALGAAFVGLTFVKGARR